MPSYNKINYRLRPAKNMERKMMADMLQKLAHIKPLREYRYIGFGSTFFTDFRMFHKRLGIHDMINIEQVYEDERRFKYNRPFSCIDLVMEKSTDALPTVDWDKPTILWLDYESNLQEYMLENDFRQFFVNAPAGSLIFITVNAQKHHSDALEDDESRIDRLEKEVGAGNVPSDIGNEDLFVDKPGVYRDIITELINYDYLDPRNSGMPEEEKVRFQQLVHFVYEDDAKMMTLGGILLNESLEDAFQGANFEELKFVSKDGDQYEIPTPNLTFEEMRGLDKQLPKSSVEEDEDDETNEDYEDIPAVPVPDDKKEEYAEIYRYFPRFVESEL